MSWHFEYIAADKKAAIKRLGEERARCSLPPMVVEAILNQIESVDLGVSAFGHAVRVKSNGHIGAGSHQNMHIEVNAIHLEKSE